MGDVVYRMRPSRADPEELAILALGCLAADDERLGRFLPCPASSLARTARPAEMPGFFLSVMYYIAADERLVMGLAEYALIRPEAIMRARAALAPHRRFTPSGELRSD